MGKNDLKNVTPDRSNGETVERSRLTLLGGLTAAAATGGCITSDVERSSTLLTLAAMNVNEIERILDALQWKMNISREQAQAIFDRSAEYETNVEDYGPLEADRRLAENGGGQIFSSSEMRGIEREHSQYLRDQRLDDFTGSEGAGGEGGDSDGGGGGGGGGGEG